MRNYFGRRSAVSSDRTGSATGICFVNEDLDLRIDNCFPGLELMFLIAIGNFDLVVMFCLCLICHQMIVEMIVGSIFFFSKAN